MTRITRVEVITDTGRDYVCWEDDNDITASHQDGGRTLKVFVDKVEPKTFAFTANGNEFEEAALEAFEEWLGPEPPQEPELSPI